MLTRLQIRNFKRLGEADIELGKSVVFIGPNNSGKTTALQALSLWEIGLRQWLAKRGDKAPPEKRPGVAINRRDLTTIPVPNANLLWRKLHVRDTTAGNGQAKQTRNVRIDVTVDGVTQGNAWSCGLEFDFANSESLICRPLRLPAYGEQPVHKASFTEIPEGAAQVKVAYLPPMSGLAAVEPKWEPGRIGVLLGEGQTAQVIRNLCFQIYDKRLPDHKEQRDQHDWTALVDQVKTLFGVTLLPPEHVVQRGEITMTYKDPDGTELDLSSSGRGLQQTLLLLAHLYANPATVLLLDEPDAHLEFLRQRQTFQLLSDMAEWQGSQIIAASHSEVVLNEAAARGSVVAFVGKPHLLKGRGSQVLKSLTDLGWDQYYQAEEAGWVLYVEDATDLAILQAFANVLHHEEAAACLRRPFVHYVATNLPQRARDHFFGLREAKPDLVGLAVFDRLEKELHPGTPLVETMWKKREIENYLTREGALLEYARDAGADNLFGLAMQEKREAAMRDAISAIGEALRTLGKPAPWSPDVKATDEFLDPLFKRFFATLQLPLLLRKADYHLLVKYLAPGDIDFEVREKLDLIVSVAGRARPQNE